MNPCNHPRCGNPAVGMTAVRWEPCCVTHALEQAERELAVASERAAVLRAIVPPTEIEGQGSLL